MNAPLTNLTILIVACWTVLGVNAGDSEPATGPVAYPEHMQWWGEGSEVPTEVYDNLYREFNPTNFNAAEWVALAQAAGMKYLVFTSRHHDGFSMFDTRASDYKITSPLSPFGRDVVEELAEACHAAGLHFGLYYSQPDWHSPDAFTPDRHDRYLAYLKQQVTELCSNYGRLDILWFDGLGKPAKDYDGEGLVRIIRGLQPKIIINDRTGLPEDHDTPEQRVGKYQDDRPWESCITICRQWAWKPGDDMKSFKECIQTLVRCAGGDGNLLFNVGPMPDGRIEPRQVERLREMGAWLSKNGGSIYGTRGGPWKPTQTLASTRKGNTIFLHIFRWDGDRIVLPDIACRIERAHLLGGGVVEVRQADGQLMVSVPPANRDAVDTIVRLDLDGSALQLPVIMTASSVKATSSNVYQNQVQEYGPEMAFDRDDATRWATDSGTRQSWIAADFGKPLPIRRVRIAEAEPYAGRVGKFEFQYRDGPEWKTIFAGDKLSWDFQRTFPPVTAREFRLNILDASDGPTLSEIEFFEQ